MNLNSLRSILTDEKVNISISTGVSWFITVDESTCEEIFKVITLANNQDYECEVYGLVLEESEGVKAWVQNQEIKISCFIVPDDLVLKKKLGIKTIPWFNCVVMGKLVYSSDKLPKKLKSVEEGDGKNEETKQEKILTQDKHLDGRFLDIKTGNKNIESTLKGPLASVIAKSVLKSSLDPANTNKQSENGLEKAKQKILKLKLTIKQHEQTIEDYKVEMRQLRLLAGSKNPEKLINQPSSLSQSPEKKTFKSAMKLDSLSRQKFSPFLNSKIDESEFWKIENQDESEESVKFEDIAASKDLWLMKLLKQKNSRKILKITKPLPPLQSDKGKNASPIKRYNSNNAKYSKVFPNYISKKAIKH
jgi:hypothetical protein